MQKNFKKQDANTGATDEIWTRDPSLTMGVLYPWATVALQ